MVLVLNTCPVISTIDEQENAPAAISSALREPPSSLTSKATKSTVSTAQTVAGILSAQT